MFDAKGLNYVLLSKGKRRYFGLLNDEKMILRHFVLSYKRMLRKRNAIFQEGETKKNMVLDPMSERFLSKWAQPNPIAKNDVIGRRRDALTTSVGGRRFTNEENTKSRAAIPILHDPRNNVANTAFGTGVSYSQRFAIE